MSQRSGQLSVPPSDRGNGAGVTGRSAHTPRGNQVNPGVHRPPLTHDAAGPAHQARQLIPTHGCHSLTERGVFDKSHIHQASSGRRLVIEATY